MDEQTPKEDSNHGLIKCPFCSCYFCNEKDMQRHLRSYGTTKAEHFEEYKKIHARLEHGSFNSPE